jgi:hypothetical protein
MQMSSGEAHEIALNLDPESDDDTMEELRQVMEARGIHNAFAVLAKLQNPHLEDDFHRFLIAYIAGGIPPKGLNEGQPEWKALSICTPPPTPTPENTNARCTNGVDDDADGSVDCADPDCAGVSACLLPTPQIPPEPIPQEPEPTPTGQVITILPSFYGAAGTIQLLPDEFRVFGAPAGSAVLVVVPISGLGALPNTAFVTVEGSAYALSLSQDGTSYQGTFLVPAVGSYPVSVAMTFQGGGAALSNFTLRSPRF